MGVIQGMGLLLGAHETAWARRMALAQVSGATTPAGCATPQLVGTCTKQWFQCEQGLLCTLGDWLRAGSSAEKQPTAANAHEP